MEYTKGEWSIEPVIRQCFRILAPDNYELARVHQYRGEQQANAHLIAQAPRLYEALKGLIGQTKFDPGLHTEMIAAQKVIAKVEEK